MPDSANVGTIETALHEMLHAATEQSLWNPNAAQKQLIKKIEGYISSIKKIHAAEVKKQTAILESLKSEQTSAIGDSRSPEEVETYALKNIMLLEPEAREKALNNLGEGTPKQPGFLRIQRTLDELDSRASEMSPNEWRDNIYFNSPINMMRWSYVEHRPLTKQEAKILNGLREAILKREYAPVTGKRISDKDWPEVKGGDLPTTMQAENLTGNYNEGRDYRPDFAQWGVKRASHHTSPPVSPPSPDTASKIAAAEAALARLNLVGYGLSDNYEFLAHMLTSESFRASLESLPKGEGKSFVQLLFDAIADLLLGKKKIPGVNGDIIADLTTFVKSGSVKLGGVNQGGEAARFSVSQAESTNNESVESPNNVFGNQWIEIPENELAPWHKRAVLNTKRAFGRGGLSDIRAVTPRQSNEKHILPGEFTRELRQIFQKKVVLVGSFDGKAIGFDGAVHTDDLNTIVIDANASSGWSYLLGHELGHSIQHQQPELYDSLRSTLLDMASDWADYKNNLNPTYNTQEKQEVEFINDFIGSQFGEPDFWKQLKARDASAFSKLVDLALKYLQSIGGRITAVGRDVRPYFNDIDGARLELIKTLEAYKRGEMPDKSVRKEKLKESPDMELSSPEFARSIAPAGTDLSNLDSDQIAEELEDVRPLVAEDIMHALVNREIAHAAGMKSVGGDTPRLRSVLDNTTTGNPSNADRNHFIINPEQRPALVSYLKGAANAIWDRLKDRFDTRSAVYVDRLVAEVARAESGYRVTDGVMRFMPAMLDNQGMYSSMEQLIESKAQGRAASPEQLKALLTRDAKAEEVKWSGVLPKIDELAAANGGKVSKAELMEFLKNEGTVKFEEVTLGSLPESAEAEIRKIERLRDSGGQISKHEASQRISKVASRYPKPQFAQHVLSGGSNYREVVLAMLSEKLTEQEAGEKFYNTRIRQGFGPYWSALSVREQNDVIAEMPREEFTKSPDYTSPHFPDVPNYVAHMRTNERDGGLFIEELQSDRHQAGRKQGYKLAPGEEPTQAYAKGFFGITDADWNAMPDDQRQSYVDEIKEGGKHLEGGIADAPFRTSWPLALFKRALRDAVAGGKTWIGWTVGETQNDRFDLSKQVDAVKLIRQDGGNFIVVAEREGEEKTVGSYAKDKLPEVIGKELASKVDTWEGNPDYMVFREGDLKVGGSGMKGFYDTMLPKEIGKYVKQWGGKVEQSTLADGTPIWRIDITPAMRDSVSTEGQARFSVAPATDDKGNLTFKHVNFVFANDNNKLYTATDKDINQKPGWLKRMFAMSDDMRKSLSAIKKGHGFRMNTMETKFDRLNRTYREGVKKEGTDEVMAKVREAGGSNKPGLSPEAEQRVNSKRDERMKAAGGDVALQNEAQELAWHEAKAEMAAYADELRRKSSDAMEWLSGNAPILHSWASEMRDKAATSRSLFLSSLLILASQNFTHLSSASSGSPS